MTNEEADSILSANEWSKWSDARELIQQIYHLGRNSVLNDLPEACFNVGIDHSTYESLYINLTKVYCEPRESNQTW